MYSVFVLLLLDCYWIPFNSVGIDVFARYLDGFGLLCLLFEDCVHCMLFGFPCKLCLLFSVFLLLLLVVFVVMLLVVYVGG